MTLPIRSRAPLRLGLAGGGTDVPPYCDRFGGAVLNATIDLYAYCTILPSTDEKIHFIGADMCAHESYDPAPELPTDGKFALHAGVYNRIVREFNMGEPLAISVTTACDAPPGSGLGSSSTLVVAMVQAFTEMLRLPMGEYDVAALAYQIERNDLALQGGKQDQYAAVFGGFNFMEFHGDGHVLVNPLRIKPSIVSELEGSLVLFYTGQSRDSAAIIAEEASNVHQGNDDAIAAMHRTKAEAFRMKDALLRGDIVRIGEVMQAAWDAKKRMAKSISNDRIERFYEVALRAGAYCGKVTGAGGGGFMMFLVEMTRRFAVIQALEQLGEGKVLGCHFRTEGADAWRVEASDNPDGRSLHAILDRRLGVQS
jgi:D-glycero-alpha-D-manno-heptose-7-phosphate kinase